MKPKKKKELDTPVLADRDPEHAGYMNVYDRLPPINYNQPEDMMVYASAMEKGFFKAASKMLYGTNTPRKVR